MEKLISMTDFVLEQRKKNIGNSKTILESIFMYSDFLKQPLNLSMFVPCKLVDGVWVVLEEPKQNDLCGSFSDMQTGFHYEKEYQEAKDRVLFDGFKISFRVNNNYVISDIKDNVIEFSKNGIWIFDEYKSDIIEDLSFYSEKEKIPIELTETAKKQIYGIQ